MRLTRKSTDNKTIDTEEGMKKHISGEAVFKAAMFVLGLVSIVVMVFSFNVSWEKLSDIIFKTWWLPAVVLTMWAPLYLMSAYAWLTILRGQGPCNVGLTTIYKWTVTGMLLMRIKD